MMASDTRGSRSMLRSLTRPRALLNQHVLAVIIAPDGRHLRLAVRHERGQTGERFLRKRSRNLSGITAPSTSQKYQGAIQSPGAATGGRRLADRRPVQNAQCVSAIERLQHVVRQAESVQPPPVRAFDELVASFRSEERRVGKECRSRW